MRATVLAVLAALVALCCATVSLGASSSANTVRPAPGVVYYLGPHILNGPFRMDTTSARKMFLVDRHGQRYPFKVMRPTEPQPVVTMSSAVAEKMPDALDATKNLGRDQLDSLVCAEAQKAYASGMSKQDVLELAKSLYLTRRDLITSVDIRSDGSLLKIYPGWRMPVVLKLDLSPANVVSSDTWTRGDAVDLQRALDAGATVVLGWNGQYQIIPRYQIAKFTEELKALGEGRAVTDGQLYRPELIEPFKNPRPLTDLKALGEKE